MLVTVGLTDWMPEVDFVPVHWLDPEAVQEVALVELHESVEDCPEVMLAGETERVTVGAGVPPNTTSPANSLR